MAVFPNPSSQEINLQFTHHVDGDLAEIIDLNGQVVKSIALPENKTEAFKANISDLQIGMYCVKVISKQGIVQEPLIIAR